MGAKVSSPSVNGNVPDNNSGGLMVGSSAGPGQRTSGNQSRFRTQSSTSPQTSRRSSVSRLLAYPQNPGSSSARYDRHRARSEHFDYGNGSSDGEDSDDENATRNVFSLTSRRQTAALRAFLTQSVFNSGFRCPLCKQLSRDGDEFQAHVIFCLTKPRLTYNVDRLEQDRGEECVICFEDFLQGEIIARLPCLCIYHKRCIDDWFKVNRRCPQHPNADASDYEASTLMQEEVATTDSNDHSVASASAIRPQSSTSNDLVFSGEQEPETMKHSAAEETTQLT